jgi:hypothetical protein
MGYSHISITFTAPKRVRNENEFLQRELHDLSLDLLDHAHAVHPAIYLLRVMLLCVVVAFFLGHRRRQAEREAMTAAGLPMADISPSSSVRVSIIVCARNSCFA